MKDDGHVCTDRETCGQRAPVICCWGVGKNRKGTIRSDMSDTVIDL